MSANFLNARLLAYLFLQWEFFTVTHPVVAVCLSALISCDCYMSLEKPTAPAQSSIIIMTLKVRFY